MSGLPVISDEVPTEGSSFWFPGFPDWESREGGPLRFGDCTASKQSPSITGGHYGPVMSESAEAPLRASVRQGGSHYGAVEHRTRRLSAKGHSRHYGAVVMASHYGSPGAITGPSPRHYGREDVAITGRDDIDLASERGTTARATSDRAMCSLHACVAAPKTRPSLTST